MLTSTLECTSPRELNITRVTVLLQYSKCHIYSDASWSISYMNTYKADKVFCGHHPEVGSILQHLCTSRHHASRNPLTSLQRLTFANTTLIKRKFSLRVLVRSISQTSTLSEHKPCTKQIELSLFDLDQLESTVTIHRLFCHSKIKYF